MTKGNKKMIIRTTNFACILVALMMITGCDGMKTEIDIDAASFPPKLCVTAILDGGSDHLSIVISEGRALADYKEPFMPPRENKRNGEIRLYEDDRLILSESGVFNLASAHVYDPNVEDFCYDTGIGHRFNTSVATHPGSAYRLEVEVEGYKTAISTSMMPPLPDVSATIDTTVTVYKDKIKIFKSIEGENFGISGWEMPFWTISLQWGERAAGRNYYGLQFYEKTSFDGSSYTMTSYGNYDRIVYVSDLSKLQDNPEVEWFEIQEIWMDKESMNFDMYGFRLLLMSDMSFLKENASLTLYKLQSDKFWGLYYPSENVYHKRLFLRVRHITKASFRYYRSLLIQSEGIGFFTEPVNIEGNI